MTVFNVESLTAFAHMLSMTLGSLMQITLSDRKTYLFVDHPIDSSLVVGTSLSESEQHFLSDPEFSKLPFVVNYKSLSSDLHRLRSSTYFFRDEDGNIEYLLTLSANVDEFIRVRELMDIFTNGITPTAASSQNQMNLPKLNLSAHDLIDTVVTEGQKRYGTTVGRMTKMEKQSLIREMHSRGVFLVKGTVPDVASKLNYSETTIYRYLQKLEAS